MAIDLKLIDELLADYKKPEDIIGEHGLLKQLTKGKVEGLVGYARRNFFVPAPRCTSYAELNERLGAECRSQRGRKLRGQSDTIEVRLERDLAAMLALPSVPYEACAKVTT